VLKPLPLYGGSYLSGAHHPHCSRHSNHLIWFGRRPLCLGCTCIYTGAAIGAVAAFALQTSSVAPGPWLFVHLSLLIPTALQPFVQNRIFKMFARTILGVASASYFITGALYVLPPVPRLVFVGALPVMFIVVWRVLSGLRKAYAKDPCRSCPLGVFPTCEWNLPRLIAANPEILPEDRSRSEHRSRETQIEGASPRARATT
jgi:hypothetical protein